MLLAPEEAGVGYAYPCPASRRIWAAVPASAALTSITDEQAEILSKLPRLTLNGLTSITDEQAESLSKVEAFLRLAGLNSITDAQAESLSKVEGYLHLHGLASITDAQAESLSKVEFLYISEALHPLID